MTHGNVDQECCVPKLLSGDAVPMPDEALTACPECDLLVCVEPESPTTAGAALPDHFSALCPRCGAHLYKRGRHSVENSLAIVSAALVLLLVANAFPVVGLDIKGHRVDTTVLGAARQLWQEGMPLVSLVVILTTVLMPLVELGAMFWMVLPLHLGRRPPGFVRVFRTLQLARPWAMVDVFIMGILVALVKLSHLAEVLPGIAMWSFGGLMLLLTVLAAVLEPRDLWQAWEAAPPAAGERFPT